jgi:uncharacterized protein (TIGR02145 family)
MRTKLSVRVKNFEPLTKIALAATLGFALALTFSCSSDGGGNNPNSSSVGESGSSSSFAAVSSSGNGGSNSSSGGSSSNGSSNAASSSSITQGSSSSVVPVSSSSLNGTSNTFTDVRDGKSYRYVKIGAQTWMAENLNYNATGSKCYNNNTANCTTYGRLYNWATARTACPSGWYLPSEAEWARLANFVGTNAGTKLKAKSGWNSYSGVPAGTDAYGFAALPGGIGGSVGDFRDVGNIGHWWSANVTGFHMDYNKENPRSTAMTYNDDMLLSVRCVMESSSSSSSSILVTIGTFTDARDSKAYKSVKIGEQVWMAENLNYNATGSRCYDNNTANCTTYGRLYNWATAMALPSNSNPSCNSNSCSSQINAKHKGICPTGWHIPSNAEWTTLTDYVEAQKSCTYCAGEYLKSTDGWRDNGNGTDAYGFSALPGGFGGFGDVGEGGNWWSATEYNASLAWSSYMYYLDAGVYRDGNYYKGSFFSVRCVQD